MSKPTKAYISTIWACFTTLEMMAMVAMKGDKYVRHKKSSNYVYSATKAFRLLSR